MLRLLVTAALLAVVFLPCGLGSDGCDEQGATRCSSVCHLGCATVPLPAPAAGAQRPGPGATPLAAEVVAAPRQSAFPPELPPPRS